jgi:flavodoxin
MTLNSGDFSMPCHICYLKMSMAEIKTVPMKTVIVYYSYSGNNESLAKELRLRLGCDIVKIEEQRRRTGFTILLDLLFKREPQIKDPNIFFEDYKMIIFISPIWDAKIASPLSVYLKTKKVQIDNYAFITICGGREGQSEKIEEQLFQLVGKKPAIVTELSVNELLPDDQKNKVKFVTAYRINDGDFDLFKKPIQNFVNKVFSYAIEQQEKKPLMTIK